MKGPGRIVICGAGVIGAAIAQALGSRGAASTVIDRVGVAPGASGKAGGFLALDWNDQSAVGPLARRSFALHRELSATLAADYGYRTVETVMVAGRHPRFGEEPHSNGQPEWLDGNVAVQGVMGTHTTTAQLNPKLFTKALVADAESRGAEVLTGRVDAVRHDGSVNGVVVDGDLVPADVVVAALGPWTGSIGLPLPRVDAYKGSSIVLAADVPPQAVFSDFIAEAGIRLAPEIYPRDGEVYVTGAPSADPLPESADQVTADLADCDLLHAVAAGHSSKLASAGIVRRQACFRPVTADGLPLIGAVRDMPGVFVATGHGPWGILNAPATGEMVAEMILDGAASSVDASPFSPFRR